MDKADARSWPFAHLIEVFIIDPLQTFDFDW
jgi:hypothetical protein